MIYQTFLFSMWFQLHLFQQKVIKTIIIEKKIIEYQIIEYHSLNLFFREGSGNGLLVISEYQIRGIDNLSIICTKDIVLIFSISGRQMSNFLHPFNFFLLY